MVSFMMLLVGQCLILIHAITPHDSHQIKQRYIIMMAQNSGAMQFTTKMLTFLLTLQVQSSYHQKKAMHAQ